VIHKCVVCGDSFESRRSDKKTCSVKCRKRKERAVKDNAQCYWPASLFWPRSPGFIVEYEMTDRKADAILHLMLPAMVNPKVFEALLPAIKRVYDGRAGRLEQLTVKIAVARSSKRFGKVMEVLMRGINSNSHLKRVQEELGAALQEFDHGQRASQSIARQDWEKVMRVVEQLRVVIAEREQIASEASRLSVTSQR
jgi:hypothetical protein